MRRALVVDLGGGTGDTGERNKQTDGAFLSGLLVEQRARAMSSADRADVR